MKLEVELELRNVFGGDGELRYEPKEKITLSRTRSREVIKETLGIVVKVGTKEKLKEEKLEPINTFRLEKDEPMLRMGGAHGKLWGAIKASAKQLYDLGDDDFQKSYKAAVDMITISPDWIQLETTDDFRVEGIPQLMAGGKGTMIVQQYDVIPNATAKVVLTFPDPLLPKVEKLLKQLEMGTHMNKRRTSLKVLKMKQV